MKENSDNQKKDILNEEIKEVINTYRQYILFICKELEGTYKKAKEEHLFDQKRTKEKMEEIIRIKGFLESCMGKKTKEIEEKIIEIIAKIEETRENLEQENKESNTRRKLIASLNDFLVPLKGMKSKLEEN